MSGFPENYASVLNFLEKLHVSCNKNHIKKGNWQQKQLFSAQNSYKKTEVYNLIYLSRHQHQRKLASSGQAVLQINSVC